LILLEKKILLAEDDSAMRRFVEIILQQAGYEVLTAEDGLKAMETALANEIDAVVADAVMPHLSGYDLCRMLRPRAKKLPLIILSGLEQNAADDAGLRRRYFSGKKCDFEKRF
jgi:DNA-binding response OmpR family regulator